MQTISSLCVVREKHFNRAKNKIKRSLVVSIFTPSTVISESNNSTKKIYRSPGNSLYSHLFATQF